MASGNDRAEQEGSPPCRAAGGLAPAEAAPSDSFDMCAPSEEDAKKSLSDHVADKGVEIHRKFGPRIGWSELLRLLDDRACVRYPCRIFFDALPLEPGEFAYPVALGERPEDGFHIHVHPVFEAQLEAVPALVLYQLVVVNYGGFATADDAEAFGAAALGVSRDEYYSRICYLADQVQGASAQAG